MNNNLIPSQIQWRCVPFSQLSSVEAYELIKLRIDVFVVEQECAYPELDNKDLLDGVYQLLGYKHDTEEDKKELVACARLLDKGISYNTQSIGRVIVHEQHRGGNLGHELFSQAILQAQNFWHECELTIGAQAHLEQFYAQHGFNKISEPYHEDGIPHIDMFRPAYTRHT